jgi:threonine dehydratase
MAGWRGENQARDPAAHGIIQGSRRLELPAPAAAAAAVLFQREELDASRRVACVLSGANVTIDSFVAMLQRYPRVPE